MATASHMVRTIAMPAPDPQGEWSCRLSLDGKPEATFEATEELLQYFSRLARLGAFASSVQCIRDSRFDFEVTSVQRRFEARVRAKNVHPGTWTVLLQLLAHCHSMEPYDEIALIDEGRSYTLHGATELAPSLIVDHPPPPSFSQLDISIPEADLPDADDSLSITVKCARRLLNSDLDQISTIVDDWGSLMYTGAFTLATVVIDEPLLDKPTIVRNGWEAFEVSIGHWVPNQDALSALLNLLIAMRDEFAILSIERE
jgi:hypothetical protein